MQSNNPETFVPIDDVARHFSVSVSTVRTWVRNNRIPRDTYIKLGNTYRFQISAITEALTRFEEEPQQSVPHAPLTPAPEKQDDQDDDNDDDDFNLDDDF